MKDIDYISSLTNIDDCFLEEASGSCKMKTKHNFSKKIIAIAIAAVLAVLTSVVCVAYNSIIASARKDTCLFAQTHPLHTLSADMVRLKELCEEYNIDTNFYMSAVYDYHIKHVDDYYYEYGFVETESIMFAFYLTNDDSLEIKIETHQYLHNKDNGGFDTQSHFVKNYGNTVIIKEVEEGWESYGTTVLMYGDGLDRTLGNEVYSASAYNSRLSNEGNGHAESLVGKFHSESYQQEFISR